MAQIKKLKLKLKSGLLSELQSDTIFGHFAWRFKEEHGEEKLLEFLDYFVNGNPIFTISDGLFHKNDIYYFPKPLKLTTPKFEQKSKSERIKDFIKQKESKSQKFVTLNQLNLYLNGDLNSFDNSLSSLGTQENPGFLSDLRVSVGIDRKTFKSMDGKLFTYNPKYLDDKTFINIFVKIIDSDKWDKFNCESILKSVFEIGFGKKKSSGYGQFEIIGKFENFNDFSEPEISNGFISLSHILPANNDKIMEAFYNISVKHGKFGEEKSNSKNPFKKPLILLTPGSCFITDEKREFYGRAVDNISNSFPDHIHNGIAFTLKAKL